MSKNYYEPCPDCGSTTFSQTVTQVERVHATEDGDVDDIESTDNFEVQSIECADCGAEVFAR